MILLVYTASNWPLEILQLGRWEDLSREVQGFGIRKTLMSRMMAGPDLPSLSASPKASILHEAFIFPKMRMPGKASGPEQMEYLFRVCHNLSMPPLTIARGCFCGLGASIWDGLRDAQMLTQFWNTIFCNQWPGLTKWSFPYAFLFWGFFPPLPTGRNLSITFQIWLLFHLLFEKVAAGNNNWNKIISDKWLFPANVPEEIINSCSVGKSSMLTLILLCFLLPTNILDCASKAFIV